MRDVPSFEESYAEDVLSFVHDLGFTGPEKEPQRIVQEGCLPFDPATLRVRKKVGDSFDDGFLCLSFAMRSVKLCLFCGCSGGSRVHAPKRTGVAVYTCSYHQLTRVGIIS